MANSRGRSSHTAQMIGSLIVAVLIVVVTISVVTARLGAGEDSGGGSDSSEEDGSGRGRGRGRSGSGMRDSAPVRFALDVRVGGSVQNASIARVSYQTWA